MPKIKTVPQKQLEQKPHVKLRCPGRGRGGPGGPHTDRTRSCCTLDAMLEDVGASGRGRGRTVAVQLDAAGRGPPRWLHGAGSSAERSRLRGEGLRAGTLPERFPRGTLRAERLAQTTRHPGHTTSALQKTTKRQT